MFPHTNPSAIHAKARIIGSRLTYAPLASEEARWEVVLKGVRSGEAPWLSVAADLRPALDTHPGEEMLGAVSTVLDTNPEGAVQILLPHYGADVVCGQDEEGLAIDRARAKRRTLLLKGQPATPELQACLSVVGHILESGGAG
jgi:hypothetical protein